MDKKLFNKITKEVFLDYGFKKEGNKFLLLLHDISIIVFNYNLGINNLYDSAIPYDKRYDSLFEIKMEHTPELRGYHAHEILFEEYDEMKYRELLTNMLHRYFDPYKENALQFLKDNDYCMCLTKKARQYLGLI